MRCYALCGVMHCEPLQWCQMWVVALSVACVEAACAVLLHYARIPPQSEMTQGARYFHEGRCFFTGRR